MKMKMKMKKTPLTPLFSMTYDDKNDLDNDAKKDHKHRSYCKVSSKTRCYKRAPPSSSPEIKEGGKESLQPTRERGRSVLLRAAIFIRRIYPFVLRTEGRKRPGKTFALGKECGPPTPWNGDQKEEAEANPLAKRRKGQTGWDL